MNMAEQLKMTCDRKKELCIGMEETEKEFTLKNYKSLLTIFTNPDKRGGLYNAYILYLSTTIRETEEYLKIGGIGGYDPSSADMPTQRYPLAELKELMRKAQAKGKHGTYMDISSTDQSKLSRVLARGNLQLYKSLWHERDILTALKSGCTYTLRAITSIRARDDDRPTQLLYQTAYDKIVGDLNVYSSIVCDDILNRAGQTHASETSPADPQHNDIIASLVGVNAEKTSSAYEPSALRRYRRHLFRDLITIQDDLTVSTFPDVVARFIVRETDRMKDTIDDLSEDDSGLRGDFIKRMNILSTLTGTKITPTTLLRTFEKAYMAEKPLPKSSQPQHNRYSIIRATLLWLRIMTAIGDGGSLYTRTVAYNYLARKLLTHEVTTSPIDAYRKMLMPLVTAHMNLQQKLDGDKND